VHIATACAVLLAALGLTWYLSKRPSNLRDWQRDVARLASAEIRGERVTIRNLRNFSYRTRTDYDEHWEDREYDLSKVDGLDLYFVYWGAPLIAHNIMSWSFSDGRHLAISVETRKKKGQQYSALAALFRQYELIYVVADEKDVIKLRTNVRGEQVYLYHVNTSPAAARRLLVNYLEAVNDIAREPRWYNAVTANCVSVIRQRVIHAGGKVPFSWRLFANAHLPELLYRRGQLDTSRPFEELKALSHINARARGLGEGDDFSMGIRAGLPGMLRG
jgi:hypothetical protein